VRIGNRVTEKDVRLWLNDQGWAGRSAKFDQLELHAIQPPGWIQIFRFQVSVKPASNPDSDDAEPPADPQTFFGAVRDDERQKGSPTKIWMFDDQAEQTEKLSELSAGLITLRNGQTSNGFLMLLAIFVGLVLLVTLMLRWIYS